MSEQLDLPSVPPGVIDEATAKDHLTHLLRYLGDNPEREGLQETPERILRAWGEWFAGYHQDPASLFKVFEDGAERANEIVLLTDIPVHSHCVVGSTFVETPRGRVPLQDLKHGDWIYTVDPDTFEFRMVRCENPRVTRKNAKLVRVITDNDTVICTPDHKFLTTSGEWVEAQHLTNGVRLCSLYRSAMKAGTAEEPKYYPQLLASRYSRHERGLLINGKVQGLPEHRFVALQKGDPLALNRVMVVHHDDEREWNNDPSNVELLTIGEHNRAHGRTLALAKSAVRIAAASASSGREDVRAKRSESVQKHWDSLSDEQRKARGAATQEGKRRVYAQKNHIVFGVEALQRTEDVWCLTVPGTHTFFANGIATHNCEHHMTPIIGWAHVAYIPDGKIVGISKLARVVDLYARRLQVQERLTNQIADCLTDHLKPRAVGVIITARHFCMATRGVKMPSVMTTTSALRGAFMAEPSARAELLSLIALSSSAKG